MTPWPVRACAEWVPLILLKDKPTLHVLLPLRRASQRWPPFSRDTEAEVGECEEKDKFYPIDVLLHTVVVLNIYRLQHNMHCFYITQKYCEVIPTLMTHPSSFIGHRHVFKMLGTSVADGQSPASFKLFTELLACSSLIHISEGRSDRALGLVSPRPRYGSLSFRRAFIIVSQTDQI